MKQITNFIQEGLKINSKTKVNSYKYHPKDKGELVKLIKQLIKERGNEADLNDIDTSKITDMHELFYGYKFNGNISKWDVSKVKNMSLMFDRSKFNGDISEWNVSKVENMNLMFANSKFNGDISKWNVSDNCNLAWIFDNSPLENNPPEWYKKSSWYHN